jgi:integrase
MVQHNKHGSYKTQADRWAMFQMFCNQLSRHFDIRSMKPSDLKGRHVNYLVNQWKGDKVDPDTIRNRLSKIRWWAKMVGNPGAVKSNADYGVHKKKIDYNQNRAVLLANADLSRVSPHVRLSLRLEDQFGLRREEAILFKVSTALGNQTVDKASSIYLLPSWTKGAVGRHVPMISEAQRDLLREIAGVVGKASLIPEGFNKKEQIKKLENETRAAKIGRTHGLRHGYAHRRYLDLTGWECGAVKGVELQLNAKDYAKDQEARQIISEELGHGRKSISKQYIGTSVMVEG